MLKVKLTVRPVRISNDADLDIRGVVRNAGASTVDTEIWASKLYVNGEPSEGWSWAIANGLRDEREVALPPGEEVKFRRTLPASSILPKARHYELVLEVRGFHSSAVMVERY